MKTKLLFAFLLTSFVVSAQYTLIPDINFEKKLIALNIDSGAPDGKVLTNNVKSISDLDVSSSGINNLMGIQDFLSLKSLYCFQNHLTSLDVSKNTALTALNCGSNQLASLNLSNTTLINLSCSGNQLTSLDVSKSTALQLLNCSYNQLTIIDVSNNIALTSFLCYNNLITILDVSKNVALSYIDCDNNQLTSLDVSKNTALTLLLCYSNLLETLDISKNTALARLDCYYNQLTNLDVSHNVALSFLDCQDNQLTILDVSKNIALESLYCTYNQLKALDVSQNTKMTKLYCGHNSLTSLNVNNGYTTKFVKVDCTNNPLLFCIQVDPNEISYAYYFFYKDAQQYLTGDCSSLGAEAIVFNKMSVYPNPAKEELHIDNVPLKEATVYDASGKMVKTTSFDNASGKNALNLNGLAKGIYYLFIESEGTHTTEKIIIE